MGTTMIDRLVISQFVEAQSSTLVNLADETLSYSMMAKLLSYDNYDVDLSDYYIDLRGKRWYSTDLRENRRKIPKEIKHRLKSAMQLTQINNFLGVSLETGSLEVVRNWVLYQMGRRETRDAWENRTGFGSRVVNDLATIQAMAAKGMGGAFATGSPDLQRLQIILVRRYAGYLKRWFVARGGQK